MGEGGFDCKIEGRQVVIYIEEALPDRRRIGSNLFRLLSSSSCRLVKTPSAKAGRAAIAETPVY